MIIAHLTPANNCYTAQFVNAFGQQIAVEKVNDTAEAKRRMYFHNRKYIVETLMHYLNQRYHALAYSQICVNLTQLVTEHQYASFYSLCKAIARNTENFSAIKPKEKSKYYNHYCKHILPIINYCNGIDDTGE